MTQIFVSRRPITFREFLRQYPEGRVEIATHGVYFPKLPGHVLVTVSTPGGYVGQARETSLRKAERLAILRHEFYVLEDGSAPLLCKVRRFPL